MGWVHPDKQVELQQSGSRRNSRHAGHQAVSLHRKAASDYGNIWQLVFVYLEALASIHMVGSNCNGYTVISREESLKLGTSRQPGKRVKCENNLA